MTSKSNSSALLSGSTLLCILLIGILSNHQVLSLKNVEEDVQVIDTARGALIPPTMIEPEAAAREERRSLAVTITADMQQMLDLVNSERAKVNLPALCYNDKLIAAAQYHSDQMADLDVLAHTIGTSTMSSRVNDQGYSWNSLAENVAYNYAGIPEAHISWMNSSGHKGNILKGTVQQFGFGMKALASGKTYYTQVFGGTTSELCSTGGGGGGDCDDFGAAFSLKFTCDDVKSNLDLCDVDGVDELCASTCNACDACADTTLMFDVTNTKGSVLTKDCTFASAKPRRCKKNIGLKEACRSSCNNCS